MTTPASFVTEEAETPNPMILNLLCDADYWLPKRGKRNLRRYATLESLTKNTTLEYTFTI